MSYGSHRIVRAAALALLTGALAAGCAHRPGVVGNWSGTVTSPQGMSAKTRMSFTAAGRETMAVSIVGGPTPLDLASTGAYTISGASLSQTFETITVRGVTRPFPASARNSETDQFKLDGDTLTLTKPGSPVPLVLTRDKAQ